MHTFNGSAELCAGDFGVGRECVEVNDSFLYCGVFRFSTFSRVSFDPFHTSFQIYLDICEQNQIYVYIFIYTHTHIYFCHVWLFVPFLFGVFVLSPFIKS